MRPMSEERRAQAGKHIQESRGRSVESLTRTIATLLAVIDENRGLSTFPEHRESARGRIAQAERELAAARAELAQLEGTADPRRS